MKILSTISVVIFFLIAYSVTNKANAQDFLATLSATANDLPQSLSEQSEIDELTAFVVYFHAARTELAAEGYENSLSYQEAFSRTFSAYISRLMQGNFDEVTVEDRDQ